MTYFCVINAGVKSVRKNLKRLLVIYLSFHLLNVDNSEAQSQIVSRETFFAENRMYRCLSCAKDTKYLKFVLSTMYFLRVQ